MNRILTAAAIVAMSAGAAFGQATASGNPAVDISLSNLGGTQTQTVINGNTAEFGAVAPNGAQLGGSNAYSFYELMLAGGGAPAPQNGGTVYALNMILGAGVGYGHPGQSFVTSGATVNGETVTEVNFSIGNGSNGVSIVDAAYGANTGVAVLGMENMKLGYSLQVGTYGSFENFFAETNNFAFVNGDGTIGFDISFDNSHFSHNVSGGGLAGSFNPGEVPSNLGDDITTIAGPFGSLPPGTFSHGMNQMGSGLVYVEVFNVPAPGALAMLGMGGWIISGRRRR